MHVEIGNSNTYMTHNKMEKALLLAFSILLGYIVNDASGPFGKMRYWICRPILSFGYGLMYLVTRRMCS